MLHFPPFADDKEGFFADVGGEFDVAKLEASYPSGDIFLLERIKHFAHLLVLRRCVLVGRYAGQGVEFLVVVVLDDGIGLQECLAFADQVLSAALAVFYYSRCRLCGSGSGGWRLHRGAIRIGLPGGIACGASRLLLCLFPFAYLKGNQNEYTEKYE